MFSIREDDSINSPIVSGCGISGSFVSDSAPKTTDAKRTTANKVNNLKFILIVIMVFTHKDNIFDWIGISMARANIYTILEYFFICF